ncbi:MAG TPA: hypothetical protein DCQ26_11150 [Marinilabiliales bacterium]|jgi:alpha-glucosidase|nr:MAG: hypothetical protein A2W95_09010 [Bacteroidetes bacterium GWA2_40_14]OFX57297.1 MAG: hypothetical protein A2W84_00235 [Bacteroidetes bacterium GWC2_40_13]OFX71172.1 MAG: hypothetical protein A2W96_15680 [Bacteroidetes bacterium GWD2_40_43]OFX92345.1 MAG: hypothetical protein A2W97_10275 [Bacteroidetes bacterium GWE2_40_63]OFY22948.1 MAG: hypothetical protein A2W88_04260 [Bacteroidetes bacterium GWF2_40_13]OFZ29962.1 MAG: hypothetical protein A2437_00710 [Bacteroidetes bacterium RIFOXYC
MTSKNTKDGSWVWWKHGTVYHIYPRSFYDSDSDGIGDIKGILKKLPYLQKLGIDAIWLSPVYLSPQADFGYDVSDYYQIDPIFGNFADFNKLVKEAHKLGIYLIMDMVLNHTSDQHPWFLESRASLDNPKRDWYIWKEPNNGKLPNNWRNRFGGSGWEFDQTTRHYYYHSFLKEQPDLNWRNNEVKKAMFKALKFWLDLGVDGFRLDVINFIVKDRKLRDDPSFLSQLLGTTTVFTHNRPKSLKILASLRKLLDQYPEKVSIGEIYMLPPGNPQLAASYLGDGTDSLHLAFDFSLAFKRWSAKKYTSAIQNWMQAIPPQGWPCAVVSNHDLHRSYNRRVFRFFKEPKARLEAMLLFTIRGTPFIYYGQEIGMVNGRIPHRQIKDPIGKRFWPFYSGRDKARTPMQWNGTKFAGFSETTPWLPVNPDYCVKNVETQWEQPHSMLQLYRQLIQLRRTYVAFTMGDFTWLHTGKKGVMAYERTYGEQKIHIYLNFTPFVKEIGQTYYSRWKLLISTRQKTNRSAQSLIYLNPFEGVILRSLE